MDIDKLFEPQKEEVGRAASQIQVTLMPQQGMVGVVGNFSVFTKSGQFGNSESSMHFCPEYGCIGVSEFAFEPTDAEALLVDEDDPGNPELWPASMKTRFEEWANRTEICPACGKPYSRANSSSVYVFRMGYRRVAERLADLYISQYRQCDVMMIINKHTEALLAAKAELENKVRRNDNEYKKLLKDMRNRQYVRYTREAIEKDVQGTSLQNAFYAFLKA